MSELQSNYMPARRAVLVTLFSMGLIPGANPPAIRRQGVVNAASQRPAAAGGAIAAGSRIAIYGVRFGADLASNRVTLTSGGWRRALPLLHAEAQRIEASIPADTPLGEARLTVTANGLESAAESIEIRKSAPGLFSANGEGWGPARSTNAPGNSTPPGGRVTIEGTGLAPADRPEVRVGTGAAPLVSVRAASAPDFTSAVTFQLPADAPEGCYVPVYLRVAGAPASNPVTIAVHRGGGVCVNAPDDPAGAWQGGKTAVLMLSRTVRHRMDAPADRTEDEVVGAFTDFPPPGSANGPRLLLPPAGACASYAAVAGATTPVGGSVWTLLFGGSRTGGLNAGPTIAIHDSSSQLRIPFATGVPGLYRRILASGLRREVVHSRLRLDAGRFGMSGTGGPQVGPFAVALPAPLPFAASGPPAEAIGRSGAATVEWIPTRSGETLMVVLASSNLDLNLGGVVYCNAPEAAGRLTIPADLMAQLPAGPGSLVLAEWWGQALAPLPSGIERMMGMSVFARSFEVRVE